MKRCIFCLEKKGDDQFKKPEHVIPESVGGRIKVRSVCDECNETLGRVCDQPFASDPIVVDFRRTFKLKRGQRSVINPKPIKDQNGTKYWLNLAEEEAKRDYEWKRQFHAGVETGSEATVTFNKHDLEEFKKYVDQHNNSREKRKKPQIEISSVAKNEEFEKGGVLAVPFSEDLCRGVLKWVYELAADVNPKFIYQLEAKGIREILMRKNSDARFSFFNYTSPKLVELVFKRLQRCIDTEFKGYQVILMDYIGIGSIGLVFAFGRPFVVLLGNKLFSHYRMWKNPFKDGAAQKFVQGVIHTTLADVVPEERELVAENRILCTEDGDNINYAEVVDTAVHCELSGQIEGENQLKCLLPQNVFIRNMDNGMMFPVRCITMKSRAKEIIPMVS